MTDALCPFCGYAMKVYREEDPLSASFPFGVECQRWRTESPMPEGRTCPSHARYATEAEAIAAATRRIPPAAQPSPAAVPQAGVVGEFVEACWTEQGGVHLRIENGPKGTAVIVFEAGPGGERLASVSLAEFRRERIARALAPSAPAPTEIRPPTADQVEYVEKLQRWREESERDLSSRVIGGPRQPAPTESAPAGLDAVRAEVERRLRAHEPALGVGRKVAEWNARQEERRWFLSLLDRHRAAGAPAGLDAVSDEERS